MRNAVAIAVATVALATGCAGGDDDDEGAPPGSTAPAGSTASTTTTEPGRSNEDVPLAESLSELVGPTPRLDRVAAQQRYLDREEARQEALATCMDDAGFEYVPLDPSVQSATPWDPDIEWSSDEWVRTYGFGVSTLRFPRSVLGEGLVGHRDVDDPDPNERHVQRLDEGEREAWRAAFADCEQHAWDESRAENITAAFNDEFAEELTAMFDAVRSDPRYRDLVDDIRRCVESRGVGYVDQQTAVERFEERVAPLEGRISAVGEDDAALAELAAIQADEIRTAVAVDECGGRHLSENEVYRRVVADHERAFIAAHEERLRAFLEDN